MGIKNGPKNEAQHANVNVKSVVFFPTVQKRGQPVGRLRIHPAGDWWPGRFGLGDGLGSVRSLA